MTKERWEATQVAKDGVWYVGICDEVGGGRWNLAVVRHRVKGMAEAYAKRIAKLPELEEENARLGALFATERREADALRIELEAMKK